MRRPVLKYRIIPEAAVLQDLFRPAEEAAQVLRPVGVGADRNDLAALLAVAAQDGRAGVGLPQAVAQAARDTGVNRI